MTTIVSKNGWIASDSRYLLDVSATRCLAYNGEQKFFILPNRQAVVAFSGSIVDENTFDRLLNEVYNVIARYLTKEPLNDHDDTDSRISKNFIGVIMVATADFTLSAEVGETVVWTHNHKHQPVVCGSGTKYISGKTLLDPNTMPSFLVAEAMRYDEMTGGDIYCFDLSKLEKLCLAGDKEKC